MSCPHCRESARFVSYRGKAVVCLLGNVRIERPYYHCKACHRGCCPGDERLGLDGSDATPAAAEVISMAGVLGAFARAAELVLTRMGGLRVSESTVQRLAERVGTDVAEHVDKGQTFGPAVPWAWHKDAEGKTCAYVSIDATGVPQQGPKGSAAEGRMATVAMIYNPVPKEPERRARPTARRPDCQVRYLASLRGQATLAEPLRRQAAHVGMDQAERWIAISDGGAGLEDWLRVNFGRVDAVILDFYHASEYLAALAKAWHGAGTEAAEAQHKTWATRLKHEGGAAVLDELRQLRLPRRRGLRDAWNVTVTYFTNQVHRMDYPSYRARGWQIGSGPVEAACKTVINQRLKGTGMRWGPQGADAMSHLRALIMSEPSQWSAYWTHRQDAA
jgi:hypothetical protein